MPYSRSNDKFVAKLALGLRAWDSSHCTCLKVTRGLNERPAERNVQVTVTFSVRWSAPRGQGQHPIFFLNNLTQRTVLD